MERKRTNKGNSNRPKGEQTSEQKDLVAKRRLLLETFFENGRQIAGELVQEIDASRKKMQELENDNARLRMQLKSDTAIRELLAKIEDLEAERQSLLSRSEEVERQARSELERAAAMETELSNLASLYVAGSQLHASMEPREVVQTMGQLLLQFVGAGGYVIYTHVAEGDRLVPVACEGVSPSSLQEEPMREGPIGSVFLTGEILKNSDESVAEGAPLVVVPMRLGELPVGAVVVHHLLEQKGELNDGDFELLRMLATQGATALLGARLYTKSGGVFPELPLPSLVSSSARAH